MTIAAQPLGLQPKDYEEIEAAVMETARGRSFLAEHARRVRGEESARLLDAIEQLEARLEAQHALAPLEAFNLADRLTALAWSLRERGVEDFVCGKIDALARECRGAGAVAGRIAPMGCEEPSLAVSAPAVATEAETPAEVPVEVSPTPVKTVAPEPETVRSTSDPRVSALSWLDSLPLVDRLALFA